MAKSLSSEEINSLIQATKNADRLTRLQVFALATSGLIDVVDGAFIVTGKGQRALKRQSRQAQQAAVVPVVMEAALEILDTNEAMCNHRAIWDRVGRDKFERDDVLDALRALREEGVLETIKMSGNNFQAFWRRGAAAPAVAAQAAVVEAAEAEVVGA